MHAIRMRKFLRDLNHEDPSVRRASAESLADGDERAVYPLIKALKDDNLGVQDAAMRSLMAMKNETTAYMILPLLREDSFLRNTALIILREIGKITVPLLYILLNDKDDDVRKFSLDLICDIQFCPYPEKLVDMLTGDPNANVRAAAAKALGKLQYPEAVQHLAKALNDVEWVCYSALEALTYLKDERSVGAVIRLLDNPSETIRFAAIEALGELGSLEAARGIGEYISRAGDTERTAAVKSLVKIGMVPSLTGIEETLMSLLADDEWEEKLVAIKGLVSLGAERSTRQIIDLAGSLDLTDPESEERLYLLREAVRSFGCSEVLMDILNDETVKYRGKVAAIEIAGELKCEKAVDPIIRLLKSEYRDVRRSSIKSLSQIDSHNSKKYLMEAIHDNDSHVRKTAVSALGKIGDMAAFEPLMKMLRNEQYDDIVDEFINALLSINATQFISRINEFNDRIKETALRSAPGFRPEVAR